MTRMLQDCRAARAAPLKHRPGCPYTAPCPLIIVAMLTKIALVLVLALCNGFFALSEMALVASRKSRLKQMAQTSRRAALALRHAEAPEHFLSTIQVGITLLMLVTGAVAGDALGCHIAAASRRATGVAGAVYPDPRHRARLRLISFIQIVIGELVPKRLALSAPERFRPTRNAHAGAFAATAPFVWTLNVPAAGC